MKYTIYDPTTGQILSVLTTADPVQAELNLANQSYLTGEYSGQQYYVESGQAIEKLEKPSASYTFDYVTKSWQLDLTHSQSQIRRQRDFALSAIDRVNPVWYATLTADQQAELQAYRLALLAVPQQTGFPSQVEWPAKPLWL
jgi:Phage tail assembly chaperone protein